MSLTSGYVNVRDVVAAHRLAMETPTASRRYICSDKSLSSKQLVDILKQEGDSDYKLPSMQITSPLGILLVKLISYAQPKWMGNYLRLHMAVRSNTITSR